MVAGLPMAWLQVHGGLPKDVDADAVRTAGTIDRAAQRRLLEDVVRRGGEQALLGLALGLPTAAQHPLVFVLLNASSVTDLIEREQRLNRFLHADHRVRVLASSDGTLTLEHHALSGGSPARVESLFVLGMHCALLAELGCRGLRATLPRAAEPQRAVFAAGRPKGPIPSGDATVWQFAWARFVARRAPLEGLDDVLLAAADPEDLEQRADLAERIGRIVRRDLARRWTLDEVAAMLAVAPRTLQRQLQTEHTSFTKVVEETRLAEARALLSDPERAVTEVGYVCGFADTAHFSRRFKRALGQTPTAWRAARRDKSSA